MKVGCFCLGFLLILFLLACSPSSIPQHSDPSPVIPQQSLQQPSQQPPQPTPANHVVVATVDGRAAATAPRLSTACISWREAGAHVGESKCVQGSVTRTYVTSTAFFIDFDPGFSGFFGTSLHWLWNDLKGQCIQIAGQILKYNNRPYIVLEDEILYTCTNGLLRAVPRLLNVAKIPTAKPLPTTRSVATAPPSAGTAAQVVRVIDGDTIDVSFDGRVYRVRYIGMDTPETVNPNTPVECMGKEASAANARMVGGQTVRLEKDISETDRYGRLLRYVYVGDLFVNAELVRLGYAQVSTFPPDVRYQNLFLQLQSEARNAGRGLWGGCIEPTQPPRVIPPTTVRGNCDPSYPTVCIPPPPPDLDCPDIPYRRFAVVGSDPHRFDGDNDGIGCER